VALPSGSTNRALPAADEQTGQPGENEREDVWRPIGL
jgi:hypothetical protein